MKLLLHPPFTTTMLLNFIRKGILRRNLFGKIALTASIIIGTFNTKAESFESTAMAILTQSPGFISETYSLESTLKSLDTESNLPDPELGGEYLWMPRDVDNRWTIELSWGIEWPGVYNARGKEARLKMSVTEKEVWNQRNERLAEIKDLLLDYVACRQKNRLLEKLSQNNDTIYHLAMQSANGGEITLLDLNKVKLEYANIRAAKLALLNEEAEVVSGLSSIYGRDCMPLLNKMEDTFPPLLFPSPDEISLISRNAPAVQAAMAQAESARQSKKVASMEALPSLSLGYKHAFEDAMHFNGVTWGISIPMFSSRGKQKAAAASIREAEFIAEGRANEIEAEVEAIVRRMSLLDEQIKEVAPLVEDANYNSALLKAYEGGLLTLLEYISDRNYFTTAALELVNLRLSAAKAQTRLQKYLSFSSISQLTTFD